MGYKKYLAIGGSLAGVAALIGLAFVFTQGSVTPSNPMDDGPQTNPGQNDSRNESSTTKRPTAEATSRKYSTTGTATTHTSF